MAEKFKFRLSYERDCHYARLIHVKPNAQNPLPARSFRPQLIQTPKRTLGP